MARTKKTALYSLVGPSQGDGYACTIREVQNAGDGQTCQGFAPDTDLGLGADSLVALGFDAPDGVLRDQHGAGKVWWAPLILAA